MIKMTSMTDLYKLISCDKPGHIRIKVTGDKKGNLVARRPT